MSIYTLFYRKPDGLGTAMSFTNLQRLADFDDNLNYHTLVHHFTRKKKTWYSDPYKGLEVIKAIRLEKGLQRVKTRSNFKTHNRNI